MVHGLIMVKKPKLVLSWGRFRTSASTLEQEEQCHQKKPKGGYCIAHTRLFCYITVGISKVSFLGLCSKMQIIPTKNLNIKEVVPPFLWFFRLKC